MSENDLDDPTLNIIWGSQLNLQPGSVICIPAGNYAAIRFYDLVGTEQNPIIIKNCGGAVNIDAPSYSAISLQRCKYVRLTGTGDSGTEYGIKVAHTNSYSSGIYMENFTTDVEIDHVEVDDTGFAGIMGKTDPYCGNPDTWRSSGFIMKNIKLHDNYIHNTGGEGVYLGFTGGYKVDSNRSCDGTLIFAHWLEDISIYNNIVEDTGLDGIQVNLARSNCKIYNNIISNYAVNQQGFQDFAMSLGGGVYEVFNNHIYNNTGYMGKGMQLISADSGTKVYNNVIVTPKFQGIFIHMRHEFENPSEGIKVFNNTIVSPENAGIFYNTTITSSADPNKLGTQQNSVPSYFVNNLILNPGNHFETSNTWKKNPENYIDFNDKSTRDAMVPYILTNATQRDTTNLYLLNDSSLDNYAITSYNSTLVDAGTDVSSYGGVAYDILGNVRPDGLGYDIGAYEYMFPEGFKFNQTETDIRLQVYPNPATDSFALFGDVKGSDIRIFNMSGQLVYNHQNYDGNQIDVTQYRNGNYLVNVDSKGTSKTLHLFINN